MQCVSLEKLLTSLSFNSFICYNGKNNSYFIRSIKEFSIKRPTQGVGDRVFLEADTEFSAQCIYSRMPLASTSVEGKGRKQNRDR